MAYRSAEEPGFPWIWLAFDDGKNAIFTLTRSAFHVWSTAICVLPSVFILPLPCSLQCAFYTDRTNVGLSCLKIQISCYLLEAEMAVSPNRSTTTTKFIFTLHIVWYIPSEKEFNEQPRSLLLTRAKQKDRLLHVIPYLWSLYVVISAQRKWHLAPLLFIYYLFIYLFIYLHFELFCNY